MVKLPLARIVGIELHRDRLNIFDFVNLKIEQNERVVSRIGNGIRVDESSRRKVRSGIDGKLSYNIIAVAVDIRNLKFHGVNTVSQLGIANGHYARRGIECTAHRVAVYICLCGAYIEGRCVTRLCRKRNNIGGDRLTGDVSGIGHSAVRRSNIIKCRILPIHIVVKVFYGEGVDIECARSMSGLLIENIIVVLGVVRVVGTAVGENLEALDVPRSVAQIVILGNRPTGVIRILKIDLEILPAGMSRLRCGIANIVKTMLHLYRGILFLSESNLRVHHRRILGHIDP